MSSKGFTEGLLDDFSLWAAVQDSKDSSGKPDPYKAAGIAYGARGRACSEFSVKKGFL